MKKMTLAVLLTLSFNANSASAYLQDCEFDGSVYVGTYRTLGGTYFRMFFNSWCPYSVNM